MENLPVMDLVANTESPVLATVKCRFIAACSVFGQERTHGNDARKIKAEFRGRLQLYGSGVLQP
jgi:hypothetical protein